MDSCQNCNTEEEQNSCYLKGFKFERLLIDVKGLLNPETRCFFEVRNVFRMF